MTSAIQAFEAQQSAKERISKALMSLAIARQASDFGEAAQRVYVHLLGDLDAALVARACEDFARQPREQYTSVMPATGDIREKCEALLHRDAAAVSEQLQLAAPTSIDERTYRCFQCQDEPSGWIILHCPATFCGRGRAHAPHSFAVRCPHWLRQHEPLIRERARKAIEARTPTSPEFEDVNDLKAGRYRYTSAVTSL